jgi:hypothetical protein
MWQRLNIRREALLLFIAGLYLSFSATRFFLAFTRGLNDHSGDFLANFPAMPLVIKYNSQLYSTIPVQECAWGTSDTWWLGPFHHIIHLPLSLFAPSIWSYFLILSVFYMISMIAVFFGLSKHYGQGERHILFTMLIFAVAMSDFALLEAMKMKSVELMEFLMLIVAMMLFKTGKDRAAGIFIGMAAMLKILPIIFLPYIILKKRKAFLSFFVTVGIIVIFMQFLMGFENWAMFIEGRATSHGVPTINALVDGKSLETGYLDPTFYVFLRSFYYDTVLINDAIPKITYKSTNFIILNWVFVFIVCMLVSFAVWLIRKSRDVFFDFSVITSLMIIMFPHGETNYPIFALIGMFYILHLAISNPSIVKTKGIFYLLFVIFLIILHLQGCLIPFTLMDRFFSVRPGYFLFCTAYGFQGLGTFMLLCMIYLYGYKRVTYSNGINPI